MASSHEPGDSGHPYEALTPDVVLDALATVGLFGDGRLMALSSYENRVYQVHLEARDAGTPAVVVAKFYRPGRWSDAQIAEEHSFARELADAEVPCVAPLSLKGAQGPDTLHHHAGFAFAVCPRQGGRRPELDDPEVLERIGRFLGRLHNVGAQARFGQRPALDAHSFGHVPRDWLLDSGLLPPEVNASWGEASAAAIARVEQALAAGPRASTLRLHGDCHPGNILWTEDRPGAPGGPHFVDLDDARSGVAVQDLWMLLSGSRAEQNRQLGALLDGYEHMREFDRAELALIEPLRTLRLLHYSVWLAQRADDPAFQQTFSWFGTVAYWQGQVQMLREQIEAMDEEPLVA